MLVQLLQAHILSLNWLAALASSSQSSREFWQTTYSGSTAWQQAQTLKQQEAHAQLKAHIDDEMRAVHERISAQVKDSQLDLKACVDSLARNIQDLKDAMRWA